MTALHSQPYKDAIDRVIKRRLELGWSQEELARRLPRYEKPSASGEPEAEQSSGQLQSFVSKFEQRQRRLDVTEFEHVCHALGLSVAEAINEQEWNGEPPPPVIPLAREPHIQERRLGQRRVKPGRKPRTSPASEPPAAEAAVPGPRSPEPAEWGAEPPLGGAGHSVEASGEEPKRAADSPERPPKPKPNPRRKPPA